MVTLTTITLAGNAAFATIIQPGAQTEPISPAVTSQIDASAVVDETREILDRASFIVFEGATAVQKLQTLSVDNATSEMLKTFSLSLLFLLALGMLFAAYALVPAT